MLCAVQPDVVLLDRADPAYRRNLVLRQGVTSSVASEPAPRLRLRPDVFLDRILLADDGHRPWLVCPSVLHGDLFRNLGVVLRSAAATCRQEAITRRKQMGPDARSSAKHGGPRAIPVDKINEQPATRFHPRGSVDHACMVARLGF